MIFASNVQNDIISIIEFKIDANKDVDFEYDFRNWQYAVIDLNLSKNEKFFSQCIDTKADITLIDIKFFITNCKAFIRTIITSITISNLDAQKHNIDKYAIASMYFSNTDEKEQSIKALITKKII